jgi:hypothetical protein
MSIALLLAAVLAADPLPPDLARAAADYERAQIEGDRAALEALVAPDYLLMNSDGAVESRAQLIDSWTADGFDPEPVVVLDPVAHVWPGGAALGGRVVLRGRNRGAPFSVELRYLDVWRLREGRWQVVLGQAVRVQPARR